MKKIAHLLLGRFTIIACIILLQVAWLVVVAALGGAVQLHGGDVDGLVAEHGSDLRHMSGLVQIVQDRKSVV